MGAWQREQQFITISNELQLKIYSIHIYTYDGHYTYACNDSADHVWKIEDHMIVRVTYKW